MARFLRSFMWLLVILAMLSPGLWLAWKNQEQITTLFFGAPDTYDASEAAVRPLDRVTALGRIEPAGDVIRIAGPSRFVVVVSRLLVDEGDIVEAGQLVATVDSLAIENAEVGRLRAELAYAELELKRTENLLRGETVGEAELDRARVTRDIAAAELERAEAELERSHVRSPISGRVLDVSARSGEKVGPEGIIEVADTSRMLAVAEVYETDISRVKVGQRASVRSPALPGGELSGTVSRVRLKISRREVLDTDPVADAESRVVEVEITLDEAEAVAGLTNLRVDVIIESGS